MTIFPTQYSLLSAHALGEYIRKQYGFEQVQCSLLIHNVGDTYLVVAGDLKFVFKVYRDAHRSLEEIKGEVELLNLLGQGGAKVALPVTDLQDELIQVFQAAEGIRHGVLFNYAHGEVVPIMSDQQLVVLGTEMAKVHALSAGIKLSFKRKEFSIDTMLTSPLERIRPAFKGVEAEYEYLTATAELVQSRIAGLALDSFGYGYCHYDFLPKNFHFNDRNEITFFDFDFAGQGYFVNDLASFYAHYFLLVAQQKISQQEADRAFAIFIAAYRKVRQLSDEELSAIPLFGFCWWVFYFGFHYDNFEDWSNFFFGARFIKERVALIKNWVDWYGGDQMKR